MSDYFANIVWKRGEDESFTDRKYSRAHKWQFDGGQIVPASASPHIIPAPYSETSHVDPEEAFIASLSSCHMLFFLEFAAKEGYVIDQYIDQAIGVLAKDEQDNTSMTEIRLRPMVVFSGDKQPDAETIQNMHNKSHKHCFIANSVKTKVSIEILQ